jgi:hypothetical protein
VREERFALHDLSGPLGHLEVPKFVPVRFFLFPPSESRKLYEETGGPMQDAVSLGQKKNPGQEEIQGRKSGVKGRSTPRSASHVFLAACIKVGSAKSAE